MAIFAETQENDQYTINHNQEIKCICEIYSRNYLLLCDFNA
mgnify:CR=1 FL=1